MKRKKEFKVGTKLPPNLREAVWLVHGRKCAYTGVDLQRDAFEVDHIFPKELNNPERLEEKIRAFQEFGIPPDFDLYAPANLVPTTPRFNRKKSDHVIRKYIEQALPLAKEKAQAVQELWEKLEVIDKLDHETRSLGESYGHRLGKRYVAELAYNNILEEDVCFKSTEQCTDDYAVISTNRVYSYCFPPKFPFYAGSLLLRFKRVEVYGCGLTFGQAGILNLFQGVGTPPHVRSRSFIEGYDKHNDEYLIQLGNNRFLLSADETLDLCAVIDKLAVWYLAKLKHGECEVLNSIKFKPADTGGYLMCGITMSLWQEIIRFAQAHDYASGETQWHVFDANPYYLKIFCRSEGDNRFEYRAFIRPELDNNIVSGPFGEYSPYVWLRWDPSFLQVLNKKETTFKFGTSWDVAQTYRWISSKLIPEVVDWSYKEMALRLPFLSRLAYRLICRNTPSPVPLEERSVGTDFINALEVRRSEEFKQVIEKLWGYFAASQNIHVPMVGDGPHRFLAYLLENCEKISSYSLERMAGVFESTPSTFAIKDAVERRRQNYFTEGAVSGWEIKSGLEAVYLLLEDGTFKITSEQILSFGLEKMAGTFEEYNRRIYLKRFVTS
jgi:5-methylcytosine-specific restriction endonuclease McrA